MICHVWRHCIKKILLLRIYCLRLHVQTWIHPSIKLIVFSLNSFLSQLILFNTRRNILQYRMGSLSNHEDDGSVEMSPKMSCVLSTSIALIQPSFNLSTVNKVFWTWIHQVSITVQNDQGKSVVVVYCLPPKNVALEVSIDSRISFSSFNRLFIYLLLLLCWNIWHVYQAPICNYHTSASFYFTLFLTFSNCSF